MGPISVIDITPSFNQDGTPKPLIIVGKNGMGKSILISNIVDSFFEFGNQAYRDVVETKGTTSLYFKITSNGQIMLGKRSMICYLEYKNDCTSPSPDVYYSYYQSRSNNKKTSTQIIDDDISYFNNKYGFKKVKKDKEKDYTSDKDKFHNEFKKNVFVYFPPERFFVPYWMGSAYSTSHDYGSINLQKFFIGDLNKPIIACDETKANTRWLIDILVDAKQTVTVSSGDVMPSEKDNKSILACNESKESVEKVMSCILNQDIVLGLNLRNMGNSRIAIKSANNGSYIVPTIDALSTGQMLLINVFLTIIRYAESYDLNSSIDLHRIKGIVVIDEVELHLHSDLQGSVLPRLIQMFPKVQFIITSHSPLFLLGMQHVFTDDGFDIVEMPDGKHIKAESFSEFRKAYDMVASTQLYREDIAKIIKEIEDKNEKALIITEGSSDWKHMKRAWNKLKDYPKYAPLKDAFVFLEYEPPHAQPHSTREIQMSDSELVTLCKGTAKLPHRGKIIFICDADNTKVTKDLYDNNKPYKTWDNNVFSFQIPTPEHRKGQPVCIEHYYRDNEIKTEKTINNQKYRLFLGNEFDSRGISNDGMYFCAARNSCGEGKIDIIEGDSKSRVTLCKDANQSVALSKTAFAEAILNEEGDFANISSESFSLIFDVLLKIIAPGSNTSKETTSSSDTGDQPA